MQNVLDQLDSDGDHHVVSSKYFIFKHVGWIKI